uniref:Secreted protein n=1 Tax=Octopus bimaculoides TaxID=37653 RepID=A0A0L8HC07_OCTBM
MHVCVCCITVCASVLTRCFVNNPYICVCVCVCVRINAVICGMVIYFCYSFDIYICRSSVLFSSVPSFRKSAEQFRKIPNILL